MSTRWLVAAVAAVALFAVAACNDGAVAGQPTDVSTAGSSVVGTGSTSDDGTTGGDVVGSDMSGVAEPDDSAGDDDAAGDDSALPADPMSGSEPFDVDACAVLVRAVGAGAVEAAMGDPVIDSGSLFASCSMFTAEYTINSAGSTSTGRLSFNISPTSPYMTGINEPSGEPVDGLADSDLREGAVTWHRAPYWFSLQVLPVQHADTDPDVIDAQVLIDLAKLVDANA